MPEPGLHRDVKTMTKVQDAKRVHTSTRATEQLGHPSTTTASTYVHLLPENHLRDASIADAAFSDFL